LVDGNKRTSLAAALFFLYCNGFPNAETFVQDASLATVVEEMATSGNIEPLANELRTRLGGQRTAAQLRNPAKATQPWMRDHTPWTIVRPDAETGALPMGMQVGDTVWQRPATPDMRIRRYYFF
jgi:hypothetical protein